MPKITFREKQYETAPRISLSSGASFEPDPAKVAVWFLYWVLTAYESVILIPLPLFDDQRRIANVVGVQMASVERVRAAAEAQLEAAKALPAALLRRVFSEEL